MTSDAVVIVQLPRDSAVDWYLRTYPPASVASGQVVVEPLTAEPDGRLGPPEAGEVVMSVLSPEALRDQQQVRDVIKQAPDDAGPLVIIVEAAEELREDELAVVLDATARARRSVILRVLAGSLND
jgi:hypothetical protein